MTLFDHMKHGIQSIISSPQKLDPEEVESEATERFRALMLELVQSVDSDAATRLALRIRCAATLQSLWFMRSDVMALLAPACGEAQARYRLQLVSDEVGDALPAGLRSRPSPLGRQR